jgi:hypothetical protein
MDVIGRNDFKDSKEAIVDLAQFNVNDIKGGPVVPRPWLWRRPQALIRQRSSWGQERCTLLRSHRFSIELPRVPRLMVETAVSATNSVGV